MPNRMLSMLRLASSLSILRRISPRDNFANTIRPAVAAVAATSESNMELLFGIARPMNDIVVHVGGANAGKTLSTKTTIDSATAILTSVTANAYHLLKSKTRRQHRERHTPSIRVHQLVRRQHTSLLCNSPRVTPPK